MYYKYYFLYIIGEYIFAVGSDDNSEFWLSLNESPKNLERLAYVGEVMSGVKVFFCGHLQHTRMLLILIFLI